MNNEKIYWVWLSLLSKTASRAKADILRHFGSAEAAYRSKNDFPDGLSPQMRQALADKNLTEAEKILMQCERGGISLLAAGDENYPRKLLTIPDAPVLLYAKGTVPDFDNEAFVTVIGSRDASQYGLTIARFLASDLTGNGVHIITGLARGVDAYAYEGALSAGGRPVAVLGCGADVVYPRQNSHLFRIAGEQELLLLSELPPGEQARSFYFPVRNRIMSALCTAVLVVEAGEKSGTMITANLAAEQGRDVFVVPGDLSRPQCAGSNALLRDGAICVTGTEDILSRYRWRYPNVAPVKASPKPVRTIPKDPKPAKKPRTPREKTIDKVINRVYIDLNETIDVLSPTQKIIATHLFEKGALHIDELAAIMSLPVSNVLAELTMMEMDDVVKQIEGKRYILKD